MHTLTHTPSYLNAARRKVEEAGTEAAHQWHQVGVDEIATNHLAAPVKVFDAWGVKKASTLNRGFRVSGFRV